MKKLLFLGLLIVSSISNAQTILFNNYTSSNNNDFVNNFEGIFNYVPQQTGGITGGCVQISSAISEGVAVYKPKYYWNFPQSSPFKASICFKYVLASDSKSGSDPSCELSFVQYDTSMNIPTSNNDVSAQCGYDVLTNGIEISSSDKYLASNLVDAWYKLELTFYNIDSTIYAKTRLFNLGTTGLSTPVKVDSVVKSYKDDFHFRDDVYYKIHLIASHHNGGDYLDDFNYPNAQSVGINETVKKNDFIIGYNTQLVSINNPNSKNYTSTIYNSFGQKLYTTTSNDMLSYINIESFAQGIYILEIIENGKRTQIQKIIK